MSNSTAQNVLNNLLREAVLADQLDQARLYVGKGADVNGTCTASLWCYTRHGQDRRYEARVPLLQAACAKMRAFLLDSGAEVDAFNEEGDTILMLAVRRQDAGLVAELLARGADPLKPGLHHGMTALELAQQKTTGLYGRMEVINALLHALPDAETALAKSDTPPAPVVPPKELTLDAISVTPMKLKRPGRPGGGGRLRL